MSISDEAVEAAARAIAEADPLWPDVAWEDAPEKLRDESRAMARCALEAAAPHMAVAAHWSAEAEAANAQAAEEWAK